MNKITPIIVPLYHSYHCLDRLIRSLELENRSQHICYFLDNEFESYSDLKLTTEYVPPRPRIELELDRICEENNFDSNKYVALVSVKNNLYSESVNMLVYEAQLSYDFDKFVILNPDCYALNPDWLTNMLDCWSSIKRGFDKNICTLGSLQWGDEAKTQVWHAGCMFKEEKDKCHSQDWQHIHSIPSWIFTGSGVGFHRVDGNTGTGLMVDVDKFYELGGFDSAQFPHYSSDAYFCQETQKKGWTHYCSNVEFFHQAGNSVKK